MFIVLYIDIGIRLLGILGLVGFVFMKFSCLGWVVVGIWVEVMGTVFTEMGLDPFG